MSADSQRLKSALRRIVLESPELRELLGDSDNRGDQAGSAGVGTSEAEESRLCCDGSTSDNANPGTEERDPDEDGAGQDGLDPNDPADLTSGDGTLSGVTDCATGEPICFDGAGFIPPDGWDDIDSQPYFESYTEGFYYNDTRSSVDIKEPTKEAFIDTFVAISSPGAADGRYIIVPGSQCSSGSFPSCGTPFAVADTGFSSGYCVTCVSYPECPDGSTADYCNPTEEEIRETQWPSDGCTNLAIVNGSIVGSKYDPENSAGDYSAPMDEIQLCSGGEQIGLKPAANGGWKTINATTDSGYLWDSHGNKIAHIDGNEYSDPDV